MINKLLRNYLNKSLIQNASSGKPVSSDKTMPRSVIAIHKQMAIVASIRKMSFKANGNETHITSL